MSTAYEQLQAEYQAMQQNFNSVVIQLDKQRSAIITYEYLTIASTVAAIIILIAAVVTRRRMK